MGNKIKSSHWRWTLFSGDGGNWTRVRKIRPSELYERSLPNAFACHHRDLGGQDSLWPSAGLSHI